jgi:hypothetical protein
MQLAKDRSERNPRPEEEAGKAKRFFNRGFSQIFTD